MTALSLLLAVAMLAVGCNETACKTQTAPQAQTCLYNQMNTDGQEGICEDEMQAYQRARYQRYDENSSEDITITEFRRGMMEDFDAADANNDNVITQDEMTFWGANQPVAQADGNTPREQRLLRANRLFNKPDANGDGSLDRTEMASLFAAMHTNADADGDGKVTRQEFETHVARLFNTIDSDDDGTISYIEMYSPFRHPQQV